MIDGTQPVEFTDVELIDGSGLLLRCRVGDKIAFIPPLRLLPGTEIRYTGDRGRLVLEHALAVDLGLA